MNINLTKKNLNDNKEFLRRLSTADFENTRKTFEKLDCTQSWARQPDTEMTLEAFLHGMTEHYTIRIYIDEQATHYVAREMLEGIEQFAWISFPRTPRNNQLFAQLFFETYKYHPQT